MPNDSSAAAPDRRIIIHQLYAACVLIIAGAALGLVGFKLADATIGATLGTAVIGAGAALLPSGAAASAAARAFTPAAPSTDTSATTAASAPIAPTDVGGLLADEEPEYADSNNGSGTLVAGTGRQAPGDL